MIVVMNRAKVITTVDTTMATTTPVGTVRVYIIEKKSQITMTHAINTVNA